MSLSMCLTKANCIAYFMLASVRFQSFFQSCGQYFPVWLRNRLLSTGLEPVLSQTEKSFVASNQRQFSTNIKIKIIKLIPVFLARAFGAKKTGFNLIIFHFDIRGKLFIIRCDKYIYIIECYVLIGVSQFKNNNENKHSKMISLTFHDVPII